MNNVNELNNKDINIVENTLEVKKNGLYGNDKLSYIKLRDLSVCFLEIINYQLRHISMINVITIYSIISSDECVCQISLI